MISKKHPLPFCPQSLVGEQLPDLWVTPPTNPACSSSPGAAASWPLSNATFPFRHLALLTSWQSSRHYVPLARKYWRGSCFPAWTLVNILLEFSVSRMPLFPAPLDVIPSVADAMASPAISLLFPPGHTSQPPFPGAQPWEGILTSRTWAK